MRATLVVAEMATALVLLVGAGLLIRTFVGMHTIDRGFDANRLLTMKTPLAGPRFAKTADVTRAIEDGVRRLSSLPGVVSATAACCAPLESDWRTSFEVSSRPSVATSPPIVSYRIVAWSYFDTMGIQLVRGRAFARSDDASSPPVAIINQAMARQYWPIGEPFDESIVAFAGPAPAGEPRRQIVGIVADTRDGLPLDEELRPTIYVPLAQLSDPENLQLLRDTPLVWMVRTASEPQAVASAMAHELRGVASGSAVSRPQSIDELLARSAAPANFNMVFLIVFSGAALLLAMIGVYGVTAYSVQQRAREIGVRIALGAEPRSVQRMMLAEGLRMILISTLIGGLTAFGLARVLQGSLLGVTVRDPMVFFAAPVVLAGVALLAMWVAALRCSRLDPVEAMRAE